MVVHFEDTTSTDAAVMCSVWLHIIAFLAVSSTAVIFDGDIGGKRWIMRVWLVLREIRIAIVLVSECRVEETYDVNRRSRISKDGDRV